ncbi:MAG: CapA family protein [Oscillospiraceae bacterium]|nr:CapA family protein [Oscillospiraceae bacterium]
MDNNYRRKIEPGKKTAGTRNIMLLILTLIVAAASVAYIILTLTSCTDSGSSGKTNANPKVTDSGVVEVVPESTAKILSTGDILIHEPILVNAKNNDNTYDFTRSFSHVKDIISKADFAVCNLEVTLAGAGKGYSSFPLFNTPDEIVSALKSTGFDLLLTANNHSYDTGLSGLYRTVDVIAEKNLYSTGSRSSRDDKLYKVVDVSGIKIGMINYTYETSPQKAGRKSLNGNLMDPDANDMINSFRYDRLDEFYKDIESKIIGMKKDGAQAVMLYIHWGDEYQLSPNSYQKEIAKKMSELGVDVLIGGHPHVIQPVETIENEVNDNKMLCVYSLGNALSNQRIKYMGIKTGHTEDGMFFYTTFTKYSDGTVKLTSVECVPTWVNIAQVGSKSIHQIVPLSNTMTKGAIPASAIKSSQNSYERTMALVGEGIDKFNKMTDPGN